MCVHVYMYAHVSYGVDVRSNDVWELVLSFYHVLPGIELRESYGRKCLRPLSHLTGPCMQLCAQFKWKGLARG